jgi:hypothetical protein
MIMVTEWAGQTIRSPAASIVLRRDPDTGEWWLEWTAGQGAGSFRLTDQETISIEEGQADG